MKILFVLFMINFALCFKPKNIIIPSSSLQTKLWRKQQTWYIDGKHNECEIYQKGLIKDITGYECKKTDKRINIHTKNIYPLKQPMKYSNGFEYTENFDGLINTPKRDYYFNLKIICDSGGAQNRYLRNLYYFITQQLQHAKKYNSFYGDNIRFVNILDGDTCSKNMEKFYFLLDKKEYKQVKDKVFVGDMKEFQDFWDISEN